MQENNNYKLFVTDVTRNTSTQQMNKLLLHLDDDNVREKIINESLWIVKRIVLNNFNDRDDKDELMSIGASALIDAVDRFSLENSSSFNKYIYITVLTKLKMYILKDRNNISLEELIDNEEDDCIIDYNPNFEVNIEKIISDKLLLKNLFSYIDDREKSILIMYFYENLTFLEIAKILNLSITRVSHIMYESLRKIRLKDYYNNKVKK